MRDEQATGYDADAVAAGEALAAFYRGVARSMRDLPMYNPALEFAAVGFHAREGHALGVVVTPWFMNLVRIPLGRPAGDCRQGDVVTRMLPAGALDFTAGVLDGFGPVESCSLVSLMHDFADPQDAEAAAAAALAALLDPGAETRPQVTSPAAESVALDRRRFLRGALKERRP